MNDKLTVFHNTYTGSYILELCSSPEGFLIHLKHNKISAYSGLRDYNKYWEITKIIPATDDTENAKRFKRFLDKNPIMLQFYIQEESPLEKFKQLYPKNEEVLIRRGR